MARFPERHLRQTAVYWGTPVSDGYGKFNFAEPVEIDCRWEDSTEALLDENGDEIICRAEVYVKQDLDENGMLYLGDLDDLDSDQEDDPYKISTAYFIRRFDKIPTMKSGRFLRKAFLTTGGFRD